MGQQNSRKSNSGCTCGCGAWERVRAAEHASHTSHVTHGSHTSHVSHVQRYVAAVTDRWSGRDCSCRRRRFRRPACVCTGYRRVSDTCHDDRLAAVLTLGARDLRRELDAIVINSENEVAREPSEMVNTEVYVLSVGPRPVDNNSNFQEIGTPDLSFQVVCGTELRALLLRTPQPGIPALTAGATRAHTQVDYIHRLVPDLQEITACSFYWGKMDRYEAERLLDNKPEGTFLLRDSAQEEHLFSVSFRKYGRSLHARIEHCRDRFSFDSHDPAVYCADTVTGLVEHYKDPACVMFFEPMLTAPLPRAQTFSLQQLARAVVVSRITYDGVDSLPLPPRLRAYLKEYHYRQRVRVRTLEP